jgi:tRNA G18 (ribose-2'-O)-methylase SpoU
MQLTHYQSKFIKRSFPICIICDGIESPYNRGGILRLADAFNVENVIFLNTPDSFGKRFKKTSRATEKYVSFSFSESFEETATNLKKDHYQFIALEITEKSLPLNSLSINPEHPIALIIGSENTGIDSSILGAVDDHYHINMFGVNSSMNVVQSLGIALYEVTCQFNKY